MAVLMNPPVPRPALSISLTDRRDRWEEGGDGEEEDGALKHGEAESDEREPQIYI